MSEFGEETRYMNTVQLIEILKKITINTHVTRNMMEDGKFIHAHRKNDAVIDQLSLLMTRLAESLSEQPAEPELTDEQKKAIATTPRNS